LPERPKERATHAQAIMTPTISSRTAACWLRFIGLVSKLDEPHSQLLDHFRFQCGPSQSPTSSCLLPKVIGVSMLSSKLTAFCSQTQH
jgi:hypothetical protein